MAYFDSILVTRLTVDFNRENGGLVFQPFLDFRVEIFTEDGHFLAISVFIIVTGLKPQNKKQFGVRLYRQLAVFSRYFPGIYSIGSNLEVAI